jgi:hypothetical protein
MIGIAFLLGIFIGMEIGRARRWMEQCKLEKAELDKRIKDYCNLNYLER